jgi:N6-adenosine-specific RNA methylase IME4
VILVDPPWRYFSTTMDRDVENHYPTMTIEEIMALPVSDLATETATLILCATNPLLPQCLQVMQHWGFEYKTNLVWDKDKIGLGFYARSQHELFLIGGRGESMIPITKNRPPSVMRYRRGKHSEKPPLLYSNIEQMFPGLPKIELFARVQRPGWGCWGNEIKRGNFLRFK